MENDPNREVFQDDPKNSREIDEAWPDSKGTSHSQTVDQVGLEHPHLVSSPLPVEVDPLIYLCGDTNM